MRRLLTALFAFVVLVGFASLALAQSSTRPGFSTSVRNTVPTPFGKSGIIGSISDGYGNPVKGAKLIVSVIGHDNNNARYVDLGNTNEYGQCSSVGSTACVSANGHYYIPLPSIPIDSNNPDSWLISIRAEAPGGMIQSSWDARTVLVQANGQPEYVAPIFLYNYGFSILKPTMYWVDQNIISVGMWVRSGYSADVIVGYLFNGTALTKMSVTYGQTETSVHIDAGWTWVETWFVAPETGGYGPGASFCGEVQITSQYTQEYVYDNTDKVCVAQR